MPNMVILNLRCFLICLLQPSGHLLSGSLWSRWLNFDRRKKFFFLGSLATVISLSRWHDCLWVNFFTKSLSMITDELSQCFSNSSPGFLRTKFYFFLIFPLIMQIVYVTKRTKLWYLPWTPDGEWKKLGKPQNHINLQKNVMRWVVMGKAVYGFLWKCHCFAGVFFHVNCVSNLPLEYRLRCILTYDV